MSKAFGNINPIKYKDYASIQLSKSKKRLVLREATRKNRYGWNVANVLSEAPATPEGYRELCNIAKQLKRKLNFNQRRS